MRKFNVVLFFLSLMFLLFTSTQNVYAGCSSEVITTNAAALGNYTATQTQVGSSSNISVTYTGTASGGGFNIPSTTDSITAGSTEWSITGDTCAAGFGKNASCTITIRYAPTSATSAIGTLRVILGGGAGTYTAAGSGPFTTSSGSNSCVTAFTTTVTLNPNAIAAVGAPTMNEGGMIIFMVIGGFFAVYYLRKKLYN
ncbi:MAG: hypothetical protein HQK99_15020 [Nitrospirae bacterium]|nr:hypothetical protein [Nitrospirota bacterium]